MADRRLKEDAQSVVSIAMAIHHEGVAGKHKFWDLRHNSQEDADKGHDQLAIALENNAVVAGLLAGGNEESGMGEIDFDNDEARHGAMNGDQEKVGDGQMGVKRSDVSPQEEAHRYIEEAADVYDHAP
jgi:hypothetical protein